MYLKPFNFPISQFPDSCLAIWAGVIWEILNLGNGLGEICLETQGVFINTALGHQSVSQSYAHICL